MTDSVRKLFDNFLFKVKATWLIEYINLKILEPIRQAQQIADQTIAQAQGIADSFTIRNVGTQDNVEGIVNAFARQPGTGETEHERLVTQQWPGDEAATQHTVYDSIMYIGGEEVTV
jgi:poly(A) polymerase Pap1